MKIAGRCREVVAARHRDSLEINSTLLGWSSRIARTNSPASNTFLSRSRSRSGIFVSTASSFYRQSRARSSSFVLPCSAPLLFPPRARKLVTLTCRRYFLFFFFFPSARQGGIRHDRSDRARSYDRLIFFRYTRRKAPENGILRESACYSRGTGVAFNLI